MTEEARTILENNLVGAVATTNEDGSPWVTPVHIVSDDQAVYWFSKQTTQHSLNIVRNPRVSVTLFSSNLSKGPKGVYVNGSAQVLDVVETTEIKKLLEAKIGFLPPNFNEATAYKLKIGEINRGKSTGNCWYFYS
ncbi:MAG: pyridoxamine 5'-phosphate oxidase family protein [Candidatus Microsaccharimonas sp.]